MAERSTWRAGNLNHVETKPQGENEGLSSKNPVKSGFDHEKLGKGTISALEMGIKPAKLGIFSRFRSSKVAKIKDITS